MNEDLIAGYAAFTDPEEFGAGAKGDEPGTTISTNCPWVTWTIVV